MPLDVIMRVEDNEERQAATLNDFISEMQERATSAYSLARQHLQVAAERRKAYYDIRVQEKRYQVGDWVWYYYPRRRKSRSPKWQKFFTGPFLITRVTPVD
jgi:hypothetical protein